jgi:hypothetical protein
VTEPVTEPAIGDGERTLRGATGTYSYEIFVDS